MEEQVQFCDLFNVRTWRYQIKVRQSNMTPQCTPHAKVSKNHTVDLCQNRQ